MAMDRIFITLGIVFGIYLLYKFFFNRVKTTDDHKSVYDKVLTSDEYKVKGQYDK